MTYLLKLGPQTLAFSGDVMLDDAKMHTCSIRSGTMDLPADQALRQSVANLARLAPDLLLPSHGRIVRQPHRKLTEYAENWQNSSAFYVAAMANGPTPLHSRQRLSPTVVSNVSRYHRTSSNSNARILRPNFGLILAESGRALLWIVACWMRSFRHGARRDARALWLKAIDPSSSPHMHGDHFLEAPHIREKWGAQIWALENMVDKMEQSGMVRLRCPYQAYGKKNPDGSPMNGVTVDRAFKPGETFNWEAIISLWTGCRAKRNLPCASTE